MEERRHAAPGHHCTGCRSRREKEWHWARTARSIWRARAAGGQANRRVCTARWVERLRAFLDDLDLERHGDFAVQLQRHVELAQRLQRLGKDQLTPIDAAAPALE